MTSIEFIKYLYEDESDQITHPAPDDSDTVMFRQIIQNPALAEIVMHIIDAAKRMNNVIKKQVLCTIISTQKQK